MTTDEFIGEAVHRVMWRKKVTQVALAPQLGLSQGGLSKKIRGSRTWTVDDVLKTAKVLDVAVEDLLPTTAGLPHLDSNQKPAGYTPHDVDLVADVQFSQSGADDDSLDVAA